MVLGIAKIPFKNDGVTVRKHRSLFWVKTIFSFFGQKYQSKYHGVIVRKHGSFLGRQNGCFRVFQNLKNMKKNIKI